MNDQPDLLIRLRVGRDDTGNVKRFLKDVLRRYGLECVEIASVRRDSQSIHGESPEKSGPTVRPETANKTKRRQRPSAYTI